MAFRRITNYELKITKLKTLFFCVVSVALFAMPVSAQSRGRLAYSGFSGGMMLHTGYIGGGAITLTDGANTYHNRLSGAPTGIGGQVRLHFGSHLRIGSEGYVSTLNYGGGRGSNRNQSHARIGWGGVLADFIWKQGRWSPYIGATIGGGGFRNLTLQNPTPLDDVMETNASYRKYGFMVMAPFTGAEYTLTDKIRLNFKADWMFNLTNRQSDFATGLRLYFGISFYRLK